MNNRNPDDYRHLIQRAENDARRKELEEKYGGKFERVDESKLTPEMEAEWLDHLEEFEKQFANAGRISLREYIGNPTFAPLAALSPAQITRELARAQDLLAANNVYVDFLNEVLETEAYRFITQELLDEEIDDIRIEGMNLHFIYEEFYPDDDSLDDDAHGDESDPAGYDG